MNRYLALGRICYDDDIVKVVIAETAEAAKAAFRHWLKTNKEWNIDVPIYIEPPILLSDAITNPITQLSETDIDNQFEQNKSATDTRNVPFSFMVGYEIAVEFNPYDQASILDYITDDQTKAQFSSSSDKLILTRNDETITVDINNRFELIQFFHEMCFQCHSKVVNLYLDKELLASVVDSGDVAFNDILGMPR